MSSCYFEEEKESNFVSQDSDTMNSINVSVCSGTTPTCFIGTSGTPDLFVVAVGVQFQATWHDDAAWQLECPVHSQSLLSSPRDARTLGHVEVGDGDHTGGPNLPRAGVCLSFDGEDTLRWLPTSSLRWRRQNTSSHAHCTVMSVSRTFDFHTRMRVAQAQDMIGTCCPSARLVQSRPLSQRVS